MEKKIELLVGKAGDVPVVILQIMGVNPEDTDSHVLSLAEAQQLGTSILMSCGIAIERVHKDGS